MTGEAQETLQRQNVPHARDINVEYYLYELPFFELYMSSDQVNHKTETKENAPQCKTSNT